ncbi:EamA family transporter [Actinotalea sp. K2]|uniref:EamA family transporter n=1 Tax=Actinotalea sp. K2 TaxID=2939438 RepID=UPI0020170D58|nr:EamA family transporter [Actinotalea sp. K2]MCL3861492.1 EamA family transporter [Actinotalea sp. K2]
MPPRDRALAALVAVCWGLNFPAIHLSLEHFPPFFLAALRFAVIAVPTVLLVPRPAVRTRWLLGYGMGFGVLQFAFLYLAMESGMPPGLASLVLQSSAPFTVLLAAALLRERLTGRQGLGIGVAVVGLGGIAVHRAGLDGVSTLLPVLLTLCAGLGWALGNLSSRQARPERPFRLMLWMSVVPPLPMMVLALVVDGPTAIGASLSSLTSTRALLALAGLAYTVLVATLVGTGLWTALLARHPSSTVAPFSMLVPVVGLASSWLVLGERTPVLELALGAMVVGGVLLGSTPGRSGPAGQGRRVRSAQDEGGGHGRDTLAASGQPEPVGGRG